MITYKYSPRARVSFFDNRMLRFSQPSALNDPQECLPIIEDFSPDVLIEKALSRRMDELITGLKSSFPHINSSQLAAMINNAKIALAEDLGQKKDAFAEATQGRIRKSTDGIIGILSLCKEWNVPLLWSHYADGYQGFVVGLDSESEFFQKKRVREEKDIGFLKDVLYVENLPKVKVEAMNLPTDLFYTKQATWAYEQEQRLVRRLVNGIDKGVKDGFGLPIVLFEVPIDAIREVTVGLTAPDEVVNGARKLQSSTGGGHIKLYRAKISASSGRLERLPL